MTTHGEYVGEHQALAESAGDLIGVLFELGSRLRPVDDVSHAQHGDFAERALSLALYLRAAANAIEVDLYSAGFALLRTAFEHVLMDRLLFLGDRYRRHFRTTEADAMAFLERWERGEEGTQDILEADWREFKNQPGQGELTVVRSGVHQTGNMKPGAPTLSHFYYMLYLEGYDPFGPHAEEEDVLRPVFVDDEVIGRWAERNRIMYRQTKWESLKDNLILNGLLSENDLSKLQTHYRFLSAFVHPYPAGYDAVYGRNRPSGAPKYDHYCSELSWLYLIQFAAWEIYDFKQMTEREPRVLIEGWQDSEQTVIAASRLTEHLWFPGNDPHLYDRFEEANSRAWADKNWKPGQACERPEDLKPEEIRYYANPLDRLKRLHRTATEGTTGFQFQSHWPRTDAWP